MHLTIAANPKEYFEMFEVDIRDINDLGPSRFRTQADNNQEQICHYNRNKKDKTFNCSLALRKQTSATDKIIFFY